MNPELTTTRRELLVGGLCVGSLVPLASFPARPARRGRPGGQRALVVVQLTGGNDGLNTVVPHRQPGYLRARPTIGLRSSVLHRLDDDHGLHPSLGALAELFAEGRLAIVHGVGPPRPDRSHFRSLEVWHTAEPDAPAQGVGWLGRLADRAVTRAPSDLPAIHVGAGDLPLALWGERTIAPTLADAESLRLAGSPEFAARRSAWLARDSEAGSDAAFLRDAARSTYAVAERLERALENRPQVAYPDFGLARSLALVGRILAADLGTRIVYLELGGFDTHARQGPTHAALLLELAASLRAFQRDLEASGAAERVLTLVFSEFGRRIEENGSQGTDHGAGAPVFLLGSGVRAGLHGSPPDLERPVDGDVPSSTDFRAIYATLEERWLGFESTLAAPPLGILSA